MKQTYAYSNGRRSAPAIELSDVANAEIARKIRQALDKGSLEVEIERYADNGQYSHSEIINPHTGEFICFTCPICGAVWGKGDPEHLTCTYATPDNLHPFEK